MIGKTIAHYEILEKIGEGGMGEVYRARDTKLGRDVAIKILPGEFAQSAERRARFEREARAVAALTHPNIVTIYSTEEADGVHYLTMELVRGRSLAGEIPPDGLPLKRILELAVPFADAIAHAHRSGVIHRDLKPDNILLDERGQPRVLDFGLAKIAAGEMGDATLVADGTTEAGRVLGTAAYMSPEQAEGHEADARSDVFALGILLYEMATGRRPFAGDSAVTTMSAIIKEQPRPVSDLRSDLPQEFGRIVNRCLEKDPDRRYESALGVRNDLERLKHDSALEGVRASSVSMDAPVAKKSRGAGRAIAVAAAVVVLVALGAVLLPRLRSTDVKQAPLDNGRKMIAVLPFENLGAADDEYFADGMTEEITSRLAVVEGLGVISRTSVLPYKNTTKSIREIGAELGVEFILEGTVRWDRSAETSRVRITPQLIRVADDTHLWADRYERTLDNIFAVQSEIATKVIESLNITLLASAKERIELQPTENMEAYQLYLQGVDLLTQPGYSGDVMLAARDRFERAIELDAGFAAAHARLSSVTSRLYQFGYERIPETPERALAAAREAIRLNPDGPEGHVALGRYYYWIHRDYEPALAALATAEAIDPNYTEARETVAYIRRRQGRLAECYDVLNRVLLLNPRDSGMLIDMATTAAVLGRREETFAFIERCRQLDPTLPDPYFMKAYHVWVLDGDLDTAKVALDEMPDTEHPWAIWVSALQLLYEDNYRGVVDYLGKYPLKVVETHAESIPMSLLSGLAYRELDEPTASRMALQTARGLLEDRVAQNPDDPRPYFSLGYTLALLGECDAALPMLRRGAELAPIDKDVWGNPFMYVWSMGAHASCGEMDEAFALLGRILEYPSPVNSPHLLRLVHQAIPMRDDPRFERILAR